MTLTVFIRFQNSRSSLSLIEIFGIMSEVTKMQGKEQLSKH